MSIILSNHPDAKNWLKELLGSDIEDVVRVAIVLEIGQPVRVYVERLGQEGLFPLPVWLRHAKVYDTKEVDD